MVRKKGKKGKAAKNAREKQIVGSAEEEFRNAPHSFVFNRGHVGKNISHLIMDVRKVMEPYTAATLKVKKNNALKDFINVAGPLHVSHFMIFTKTDIGSYLRIVRIPRGPTLTFKIHNYTLARDVISSLRRHNMEAKQFLSHPLLVMNGFSGDGMQLKLMTTMFQNMFPSINVNKVKLKSIRRCVLLNLNQEDQTIEFRHYNIKAVPAGVSKGVKKLMKSKVPNMGKYDDVSEYLMKDGILSESEAELDGPHNEIILPQDLSSRGNNKSSKSAIRMTEIGPRLTLQLVKIEDGVCSGDVLYHKFIQKTPEELALAKQQRELKKKLKEERKKQQADNVSKKASEKEELKKKSLNGMKKAGSAEQEDSDKFSDNDEVNIHEEDPKTDADYYREEVGENPEPELFPESKRSGQKRKNKTEESGPQKRIRTHDSSNKTTNIKKHSEKKYDKQGKYRKEKDDTQKYKKKELTPFEKLQKRKLQKKKQKLTGKKKPRRR